MLDFRSENDKELGFRSRSPGIGPSAGQSPTPSPCRRRLRAAARSSRCGCGSWASWVRRDRLRLQKNSGPPDPVLGRRLDLLPPPSSPLPPPPTPGCPAKSRRMGNLGSHDSSGKQPRGLQPQGENRLKLYTQEEGAIISFFLILTREKSGYICPKLSPSRLLSE